MPIKGTMNAIPFVDRVESMKVGQTSFMSANSLIVTRDVLFLDVLTHLILEENLLSELQGGVMGDIVGITRIGQGLTEADFEIDMELLHEDYEFIIEDDGICLARINLPGRYILFTDFNMTILIATNKKEGGTIESLQHDLENAVADEKWMLAAELREQIKFLKGKK